MHGTQSILGLWNTLLLILVPEIIQGLSRYAIGQKNLHCSASPLRWLAPAEVEDFIEYLPSVQIKNQDNAIN